MLRSLQSEDARFSNINPQNMQWYSDVLSKAIRDKAEAEVSIQFTATLSYQNTFVPKQLK